MPDGFERDREQEFERAENFLHVYSSKESGEGYTVRCSIIQPGQQSSFDNEHTTYKNVKVGDAHSTVSVTFSADVALQWKQVGMSINFTPQKKTTIIARGNATFKYNGQGYQTAGTV